MALAVPLGINVLFGLASKLYPTLHEMALLHSLVRIGLTFVVLGPPCFLMGGTLPLLIKQFTPAGSTLRQSTAWLYAINTVEQGIEILTGVPVGRQRKDGSYTPGSVFQLVESRLEALAQGLRRYSDGED